MRRRLRHRRVDVPPGQSPAVAGAWSVKLDPFVQVDDTLFSVSRNELVRRKGPPLRRSVNDVALEVFDYGGVVYRFQVSGRLEEVTTRAPVVHIGEIAIPFRALAAFVKAQDPDVFERASFLVSPRFGLAFVPADPDWVTALARHCLPTWHALGSTGQA
jgi:hypothetical protein